MKEADLPLSRRKISSTRPHGGYNSDLQGKDQPRMHSLAAPHTRLLLLHTVQDPVLQISGVQEVLGKDEGLSLERGKKRSHFWQVSDS